MSTKHYSERKSAADDSDRVRRRWISAHSLAYAGIAVVIVVVSLQLDSGRSMSAVWYGPYLSAAENVSWGGKFLVNQEEVTAFREMTPEEREDYRFTAKGNLQEYIANPLGFAYVIAAAKRLFPWLADVPAIEASHISLHTLLSLLVLSLLDGRRNKALFLVLYSLNPLVLYYVTFPYYYFYQAIPSFGLLFLILGSSRWQIRFPLIHSVYFIAFCAALALVLLMRSTTIAAIGAFFVLALVRFPSRKVFSAGLIIFLAIVVSGYSASEKNFWHTAYVGVGAYPNEHVQGLTDDNGYALFERETGTALDASLGGNYYDAATMALYRDITHNEFMNILREDWPSLARNAVLNGLQGFTIGYLVGQSYGTHLAMAVLGIAVLAVMLLTRQFLLAALVILTSATFTPYYPPIPAYMYGAYVLLVVGAIEACNHLIARWVRLRTTAT